MAGSSKWKTLIVGLSIMGVLVAGCTTKSGSSNNSGDQTNTPAVNSSNEGAANNAGTDTAANSEPVQGGTLTYGTFSDISTENPFYGADTASGDAAYLIFSNLLDYDKNENASVQPWSLLSEMPEVSSDNKEYTLKLKPEAKWSDGVAITADDIIFTIETASNPDAGSPAIETFDKVEKVEKIDDQTVKITLKSVYAPFLNALVMSVAPWHILKDVPVKELQQNPYGTDPTKTVTNGPWKWTEWTQKQHLTFEKDPNYWAKDVNDVNINTIYFKIYADQNTEVQALIKGDVDLISGIPVPQLDAVKARKDLQVILAPGPQYEYMSFNFNKMNWGGQESPFTGEKTRQAIAYAINRDGIIQNILKGTGKPINAPFLPGTWADPGSAAVSYDYNSAKAKQLLAEDGWVAGSDGILTKNGQKFEFELQYNSGNSRREQVSQIIQSNLKDVGINVTTKGIDFSSWQNQNIIPGKYQAALQAWVLTSPDPDGESIFSSKYFPTVGGQNSGWYDNPTLDKLWVEGYSTVDQAKRKEIYKQVAEQISTNLPYVFLYQYGSPEGLGSRVKFAEADAPIMQMPFGYFFHINKWWVTQ